MSEQNKSTENSVVKQGGSKIAVVATVAVLVGGLLGGFGTYAISNSGDELKEGVVATVGDEEITKDDMYERMVSTYGSTASADLVLRKIVDLESEKNKVTVSKKDIDTKYKEVETQYGGADALKQQLATNGTTAKDLREDVKYYLLMSKLVEPRVDVSDKAIKEFFEQNKDSLGQAEKVEASHILVADKKTAQSIIDKLDDGEDWNKLAKKYSTDTSNAENGGELGYFTYDSMDEGFAKAAFKQKVDTYSKTPVKSAYGYHIIKVTGHEEAKEATLDGSKATIKQQLLNQGVSTEGAKWEEEMKKEYKVENTLEKKESTKDASNPDAEAQTEESK